MVGDQITVVRCIPRHYPLMRFEDGNRVLKYRRDQICIKNDNKKCNAKWNA